MKAAIYARFSTELQRKDSIDDQFRACERVAAREGLAVVARYSDEGISGGTTQRPGYQQLLAGARSGAFEVVVAEDLSRLWRSRAEFGPRSAEFEDLGVHLITCTGDDTRRDGYGLMLGIKSAMAEYQRREISYRTSRGLEGLALSGKLRERRCFGYRNGRIHESEAATIRRIFAMRSRSLSLAQIATALNVKNGADGTAGEVQIALTPSGSLEWSRASVQSILTNRRYTGAVIWGATESYGGAQDSQHKRRRTRSTGPLVQRHDSSLEIIPVSLFEQAQKGLAKSGKRAKVDP